MSDATERNLVTAFLYPKAKNSLAKSTSFQLVQVIILTSFCHSCLYKLPFFPWVSDDCQRNLFLDVRISRYQILYRSLLYIIQVTPPINPSLPKKGKGYFVLIFSVILWLAALCSHIPGFKNSSYLNKPGLRQRKGWTGMVEACIASWDTCACVVH